MTVRVPFRVPSRVGVNVTEIWHFAPGASVLGAIGQLLVCPKSPEAEMLLIVIAAAGLLVRVTTLLPLVVPTTWLAKVRLVGFNVWAAALDTGQRANSATASSHGDPEGFIKHPLETPVQSGFPAIAIEPVPP